MLYPQELRKHKSESREIHLLKGGVTINAPSLGIMRVISPKFLKDNKNNNFVPINHIQPKLGYTRKLTRNSL